MPKLESIKIMSINLVSAHWGLQVLYQLFLHQSQHLKLIKLMIHFPFTSQSLRSILNRLISLISLISPISSIKLDKSRNLPSAHVCASNKPLVPLHQMCNWANKIRGVFQQSTSLINFRTLIEPEIDELIDTEPNKLVNLNQLIFLDIVLYQFKVVKFC